MPYINYQIIFKQMILIGVTFKKPRQIFSFISG